MNYCIVIEKWYNRWLRLLTMLLLGRIYFALGTWHFGDFRNTFLRNIGEDQKKSYNFSSGPLTGTQARSQKFAMGGCLGGSGAGPQSPEANGGLWAKPPAAGGWGSGGAAPSDRKFGIFWQK